MTAARPGGPIDELLSGYRRGYGAACLFDEDLRPKPAYAALVDELGRLTEPTVTPTETP
ncbi:hypothetical protein ACIBMZ_25140 [Micromonospora sp. NPDC049900]|uniref:hypothetical protein n=1 Tax=Micromonospora sp. NPDC049900 TaxID=3364275 RepID=UPI0037AA4F34